MIGTKYWGGLKLFQPGFSTTGYLNLSLECFFNCYSSL
uniref:Uncharacterized protein n=1 Tax=Anguilla anguilla TaxID=7936 RepID=A0A0E9P9E5_ANGAN